MLLDPTPSPPLAGGSVAELRASLPGDLSGISLEPLAESTHGGGEIVTEVSPPAASVLPTCCSEDSDVPLAALAKVANAVDKMDSRGGEGLSPPAQRNAEGQKTVSPRFSSFLRRKRTEGSSGGGGTKVKRGELSYCCFDIYMIFVFSHVGQLSLACFCGYVLLLSLCYVKRYYVSTVTNLL